jgi:hypothetical protein
LLHLLARARQIARSWRRIWRAAASVLSPSHDSATSRRADRKRVDWRALCATVEHGEPEIDRRDKAELAHARFSLFCDTVLTMPKNSLVFILAVSVIAIYLFTLAPTVLWADGAYFQRTAFDGTLRPDGGGHWLWLTIAKLFVRIPFGEVAYRVNLVSAFAGTATVIGLFLVARSLELSQTASAIAALSLAVAHTFWMHSVRTEVYTVFTALMVVEMLLWFQWAERKLWPMLAALALFGLTLLGHQMAVLLLPAFGYLIWCRRKWLSVRDFFLAISFFLVGLIPALIIIQKQINSPDLARSLVLYFTHAGIDYRQALFDYSIGKFPRDVALWLGLLVLQFPGPAILLSLLAIIDIREWINVDKWQSIALLYFTCAAFALGYRVSDQYVFYLPSYIAFAIIVGLGWDSASKKWLWLRPRTLAVLVGLVIFPPLVYFGLANTFARLDVNPLGIRELPGREPNNYFLWPAKNGYWGAYNYGMGILQNLPPDSIVIADYTPLETLKYFQVVHGMRKDVQLIGIEAGEDLKAVVEPLPSSSTVFLADDDPRYYNVNNLFNVSLVRHGMAYQLVFPSTKP